jgi:uracil-DNA glycosylase
MELDEIAVRVAGCEGCGLCKTRTKVVPGAGDPSARLVLVGEGPGEEEDLQGLPFIGRSGALLDKALEQANLARAEIFITNVVKCRPPGNRNPSLEEMRACSPHLQAQLKVLKPKLVVAVGKIASEFLLGRTVSITKENGNLHFPDFAEALMTVYHPAYVLRNRTSETEKAFFGAFKDASFITKGC